MSMSTSVLLRSSFTDVAFAVLTALGAYGGFPTAPQWWTDLAQTDAFHLAALWVLVFQGNGKQDVVFTTVIAIAVFGVMRLSSAISSTEVAELSAVEAPQALGCPGCTLTKGSATWGTKGACENQNPGFTCVSRGYNFWKKKKTKWKPCKPY